MNPTPRQGNLLQWQYALYTNNHTTRQNLMLHIVTAPLFWVGTLAVASAPIAPWSWPLIGLSLMIAAVALQGRGHRQEPSRPEPFMGPRDVLARIFVEQWITFPRFVLSGEMSAQWRRGRTPRREELY